MELPEATVIGLGGLGGALTEALVEHGIPVKSIFNRTFEKAETLSRRYEITTAGAFPHDSSQLGQIVFITVSDQAITEIAGRLSELNGDFEQKLFVHCSGNEPADLLKSLRKKKAITASFHPLQTFTSQTGSSAFNGIYFSMQGDTEAFPVLSGIAKALGSESFTVTAKQKPYLHAAAVMASNYLNTLLDTSLDIAALSGLSKIEVQKALLPLVQTTLKNAEGMTFAESLTGPIKRGDWDTVQKHLDLLEDQPQLQSLYCKLGYRTVKLAHETGSINGPIAKKLYSILNTKSG
ncbi:MAG: DUF2520 domain-containing protein [Balneolaceae bacterium]|jgi:predicted short-subunit dehydrogenase-like oxidoreductase (DUF2520 family)